MTAHTRKPSKPRFSLMIFLFVYPLVTLLLYGVAALTPGWAMWQRAMIIVPIVVICMVYVIIPLIQQRMVLLITSRA